MGQLVPRTPWATGLVLLGIAVVATAAAVWAASYMRARSEAAPIAAETAVARAVSAAQAGHPYLRLDGPPSEIRGRLDDETQRWEIVLAGRVIETVPAGASGTPPERQVIHERLHVFVHARSAEVAEIRLYPAAEQPDVSGLPTLDLPDPAGERWRIWRGPAILLAIVIFSNALAIGLSLGLVRRMMMVAEAPRAVGSRDARGGIQETGRQGDRETGR